MLTRHVEGIDSAEFREILFSHYRNRGLSLPEVTLKPVKKLMTWDGSEGVKYSVHARGYRKVGECVLNERFSGTDGSPERFFTGVGLRNSDYQGKGFGIAIYGAAICDALDEQRSFRTDPGGLSGDGIDAWKRLISLGLATPLEDKPSVIDKGWESYVAWNVVVPDRDREVELL